jgi:hypothetical protein
MRRRADVHPGFHASTASPAQSPTSRSFTMQLTRKLALISFATLVSATALPALADGDALPFTMKEVKSMANKDGMVTKSDYMKMMEKKFDAMDKSHKGMLSVDDVMRIFSDKTGS